MFPRSFCPGICLLLKVMDAKAALMNGGLGLETFTRLSISTHLPAVSMAHRGNTLMNSKDWGLGGKQMQANREEEPGLVEGSVGVSGTQFIRAVRRPSIVSPT